jgi:hypothetical protein
LNVPPAADSSKLETTENVEVENIGIFLEISKKLFN